MKTCCLIGLLSFATIASAELELNGLFTDDMVLQRRQSVPVWGTADAGAKITVEFGDQKKETVAGFNGEWKLMLDPLRAAVQPSTLRVRSSMGDQELLIGNVLVGDVWLCAGQSNMATTMKRYPLIWEPVRDEFKNDLLRLFKIKEGGVGAAEPSKELVVDPFFKESWQVCSPEFAAEFSATAGFFGMKLQHDTGVPIGLLYANRGGTRANMWMPRETLEANDAFARFLDASNVEWKPSENNPGALRAPSHLYNGTIHPLAPFAIRGVIWYQGESDSEWSELYESLMADLIASWRKEWGWEFPFLFVQLAPYDGVNWDRFGEGWAWLREAQLKTLDTVPGTGMAVITDAGEAQDIHPQDKRRPGERLAVLAASLDDPDVNADFPVFESMKVRRGKVSLKFSGVSGGLETRRVALNIERNHPPGEGPDAVVAPAGTLTGFTVCGEERKFVPARARIVARDTVLVESADVKNPVAVRYGWSNFPLCNLYGGNGMPASPFRSDDFPMPNLTDDKIGTPFESVRTEWGTAMEPLNAGDGLFVSGQIAGRDAMEAQGSYLYFRVAQWNEPAGVSVHLVYYDEGFATVQLRYDSTDTEVYAGTTPGVWKPAGEVKLHNSKQWKVVEFELPDARFSKRCNGGDVRLQTTGALVVGGAYAQEK